MKNHVRSDSWGWLERGKALLAMLFLASVLWLLLTLTGEAAAPQGNQGGCGRLKDIACTVLRVGSNWAYGTCELGFSFSAPHTHLKLKKGAAVLASGCYDQYYNIYSASLRFG
jgi:hypothetical protein